MTGLPPSTEIVCRRCGLAQPAEARFCMACGTRMRRRSAASGPVRDQLQAILGADYRVGDEIGRGGFGVVYSAQDLRLDRKLAVKVMRPEFSSDLFLARFVREAQIVAQLHHPNIVSVYFAGETDGLAYHAMRQVNGRTLKAYLAELGRPVTPNEALRIFSDVAKALHHAHQRNIVHRDVKPANIMLDDEASARAVLTDFGIAKALSARGGSLSISGQIVGSREYMSPEQANGAKEMDARSDIYSLGVVGYELLTGENPWEDDKKRSGPAPDPRRKNAAIPENFAEAVRRCMEEEPGNRWSDALDAAAAAGARVSRA